MAAEAAELSVHVRGIAEKLRKRAEDAAKKGGAEASAGLLASVDHLLQSADLMEHQHKQLQTAALPATEPASTTLRNLQLVGAMLEKKSDEMRSKQAVGPANSLAQSASHVRIGVQRLEAVQAWLASTLGDAYSIEMDWTDALAQVRKAQATSGEHSDAENALKAAEAQVASLEAELAQWKHHHDVTQAQQLQLLEQLERVEADLSSSVKSQREVAAANEALHAELSVAHEQLDALASQLNALKSDNANAEQEMQEEWERTLKQSQALAKDVSELRAKEAVSLQLVQQLNDQVKASQDAVVSLEKELDILRGREAQAGLDLKSKSDQVEQLSVQLEAAQEKLLAAEQTIAAIRAQQDDIRDGAIAELEEKIAEAVAATAAAQADARRLDEELSASRAQYQEAINSHESDLEAAEGKALSTIRGLEVELATVRDQLAATTEAHGMAQAKVHEIQVELSASAEANNKANIELEELRLQLAASTDASDLETIAASVAAATAAQATVHRLEGELAASRAQYQDVVNSHESELKAAETKALSTIHSLESELAAVRDQMNATAEADQARLAEVQLQLVASTDAADKATAKLEDLRVQLAASTDLDKTNRAKIEALESDLGVTQTRLRELEAVVESTVAPSPKEDHAGNVEALTKELSSVRTQLATVQRTAESLTADLVTARRQLVAAEEHAATNQDTIEALEEELVAVRRQAEEAVQTAGSWENELVAVRDGIARLEAQLTPTSLPSNNDELDRSSSISSIGGGVESVSSVGDKLTQLATAIRLLNEEKGLFQAEIERLEASVAHEQATVHLHSEQVRALQVHVDKTHQMHQEMRTTHEEAGMAMQEHAARLKEELTGLRTEKQRWVERSQALELDVRQLTQTVADLSATSQNEKDDKLLELTNQVHELEASKKELLEQLVTCKATLATLETETEERKRESVELHEKLAALADEKADVVGQLEAAQNGQKVTKEAFETEKFDLQAQHKVMEEQFVKKIKDLKKQAAAKDAELLALKEESQTLLERGQADVVAATEAKDRLTEQLGAANAAVVSAEGALRDLQERHAAAVDEWTMLESSLTQEKASAAALSDELAARVAELESQIAQLRGSAADKQASDAAVAQLQQQSAQLESQVAWLEQEVVSVRASLHQSEEAKAQVLAKHHELEVRSAEKVQSFVDRINGLVAEKTALEAAASASDDLLQRQVEKLEQTVHALTEEKLRLVDDHHRHVVQLQHDHETAAKATASSDEGIQETVTKVDAMACELAIVTEEAKTTALELQRRINELEAERDRLLEAQEAHATELRELSNRLKAAHDAAVQEHATATSGELAAKIQRFHEQIDALTAEKEQLQTDHDGVKRSLAAVEADKAALAQELSQARAALDENAVHAQKVLAQLEVLETEKADSAARYEADVAKWQVTVTTLQDTHLADVAKLQATIDALVATKTADSASDGAHHAAICRERDQALAQLKALQASFDEYKTRAAAALKKAEKRTALLNPMLAEKQQLETQVATLQEIAARVHEKHENQLLSKEDVISRLKVAIDDATRTSVPKDQVESMLQEKVEAAATEWKSQIEAKLADIQSLEASLANKDELLAGATDRLDKLHQQLAVLNETLELKTMLVAKAMQDKEVYEATKGQLDEALAKLAALGEAESEQLQQRSANLEAALEELSQANQTCAELQRQLAAATQDADKTAALDAELAKVRSEVAELTAAKVSLEAKYQEVVAQLGIALATLKANANDDASSTKGEDDSAAFRDRIAQLEAEKAALEQSWQLQSAEYERTRNDLIAQHAHEKAALVASLQAAQSQPPTNGHAPKSTDGGGHTDDGQVRELQLLLAEKDAALADLSRRLDVEVANEKLAFEATKLLKSQLDEKDSYVQLLKQNAELQLRQATQEAERQLAEQRQAQQVQHDAAIAALKAQLSAMPLASNEVRTTDDTTHRQLAEFQAKVAALTAENESLQRQASAVAVQLPPPAPLSEGQTTETDAAEIKKLQLEKAQLEQSMHSLRETLNEKLQQLATLKAPVHTKMLDELERTIDHEKRALFERKELHSVHMTKLKRDAEQWLDEAQTKLDEHAALQDALAKAITVPSSADDVVVNPLEVTLVLKSGVVIKAGSSFDLPVVVSAGQTIQWSFRIEELETDVNFALTFNGDTDVVPVSRVERLQGTYQAKASGVLKFEWDNAFSWLNPKTLDYHVSVFEPLTEAALQQRKSREIVKTQVKQLHDKIDALTKESALLVTFEDVIQTKLPSAIELYLEECMAHREMVVCPKLSQVQDKMNALKTLVGLYVQEQQELTEATASLTMLLEEIHQEQRDLQNTCHLHKHRDETFDSLQAKLRDLEAQVPI